MKKRVLTSFVALSLLAGPLMAPITADAASLDEMKQEKSALEQQKNELQKDIEASEKTMKSLAEEKVSLENDVKTLQTKIDEVVRKLKAQEEKLAETQEKIKKLQEEIEALKKLIAQRKEKLANQARSVQKDANTTDLVDLILSSDSFSDLLGRIGVISQLVEANQDIVTQQMNDEKTLEEKEALAQKEKAEVEKLKAEIEVSRNNLLAQKAELDDKIVQVAQNYHMTESEKNSFVKEQETVAQRTSTLDANMKKEQERILAEEAARQERQRKAEEEARQAAEQKAAEQKANEQKAAEQQTTVEASTKTSNSSSSSSSSNGSSSQKTASSSGFIRPGGSYVTSHFGYRIHPITGHKKLHGGIDFGGSGPVVAAKSGVVVKAEYHSSWGYHVKIDHGDGIQTLYAHMQAGSLTVVPGQKVSQGQQIGTMGTTGSSTGVHLHFEVYKNGTRVNPAPYLGL